MSNESNAFLKDQKQSDPIKSVQNAQDDELSYALGKEAEITW